MEVRERVDWEEGRSLFKADGDVKVLRGVTGRPEPVEPVEVAEVVEATAGVDEGAGGRVREGVVGGVLVVVEVGVRRWAAVVVLVGVLSGRILPGKIRTRICFPDPRVACPEAEGEGVAGEVDGASDAGDAGGACDAGVH